MQCIQIVSTPPGFAPDAIREQWIGIMIPLATKEEIEEDPPSGVSIGNANPGGFLVLTEKAVAALEAAKRVDAVEYWRLIGIGKYLRFSKQVCIERTL